MLTLAPTLAELPFRGNRNYLHSTDLYPALNVFAQTHFSPSAFVESLTLRRVVRHQIRVDLDEPEGAFGSFCIRDGTQRTKAWLAETDEPVHRRAPFDEAVAIHAMVCGPGFARFEKLLPPYSIFELVLMLTKIIAQQENPGHWWICQIDFISPLREIAPIEGRLKGKVANCYCSIEIYQSGQFIGSASGIIEGTGLPVRRMP
jgi:hypothetical protein